MIILAYVLYKLTIAGFQTTAPQITSGLATAAVSQPSDRLASGARLKTA